MKILTKSLSFSGSSAVVLRVTAWAAAFMITALGASGAPISVPNASFDSPSSPTGNSTNVNVLNGWVFNDTHSVFGTYAISSNFTSAGTSSGSNYAFINNDYPGVTDTLTSSASLGTIAPLTKYALTLAVGNRNGTGLYDDPGNVSFSLLANGIAFATDTVTNGTVPNGTFEDFTLTFTTPSTSSIIGDNLEIQLASLPEQGTAFQPSFDNVRLDATSVAVAPEPQSWSLLMSGVMVLCWLMRRKAMSQEVSYRRTGSQV
jgi:hypothetical protein